MNNDRLLSLAGVQKKQAISENVEDISNAQLGEIIEGLVFHTLNNNVDPKEVMHLFQEALQRSREGALSKGL